MTMTRPLRLMTLHFSQMGLTEGFTFMFRTSLPATPDYFERHVMRPRVKS